MSSTYIVTASIAIKIKYNQILNSEREREKLLGVTKANKLNFNNHLQKIQKLIKKFMFQQE